MSDAPPPFLVLALPRCRTAWLSKFLTYGPWCCGHEELRHCRSLADARSWFAQPWAGSVETAAAPFWRLLGRVAPGVRLVTVTRPIEAVAASLRGAGLVFDDAAMLPVLRHQEAKLKQVRARLPNVLAFDYADLEDENACAALFQHCTLLQHDHDWHRAWAETNVQVSVPRMMLYYAAHRPQMDRMAAMALHRMRANMLSKPGRAGPLTFQRERWAGWYPDAAWVLTANGEAMEGAPDAFWRMNVPLLQEMDATGNLHIFTARRAGQLVGHVICTLGADIAAPDGVVADELMLYCLPLERGIGPPLLRHAIEDMRALGVRRVTMSAPVHMKADALFRRVGAEQTMRTYAVEL